MKVPSTDPPPLVVEGFAGPGGWSTGLAMLLAALGFKPRSLAVEWDDAACKTAVAAGHPRVRADVARFDLTAFIGRVWLLILSPPCQAWSRSGKRKGILDQPSIFAHAMRVITAGEWIDYAAAGPLPAGEGDEGGTWHDARSPLVLEVIRWVMAVQPTNICLEQVPDVLPFWELIARWLRGRGYNVWAGCLSSERYGVPQTRERAIVIASRERAVSAPAATHTAYDSRFADGGKWHGTDGDLFGAGLEPWVSMAEALGWVPVSVVNTRGDRKTSGGNEFGADRPSWALTEKTRSWTVRTSDYGRPVRGVRERFAREEQAPSPTLTTSVGSWVIDEGRLIPRNVTVHEATVLQSFPPDYPWQGTKSAQFRQVGDAVPPRLAAAVIGTCLGLDWQTVVAAHYAGEVAA